MVIYIKYTMFLHSYSLATMPQEHLSLYLQHWYISGSVKCFQGGHAPLGILAILILAFCVTLIPLVLVYSVGWAQVLINI